MSASLKLAIALTAAAGVAWGASTSSRDAPPPTVADFKIHVKATQDGVEMVCHGGCAWQELSFGCEGSLPCSSWIDAAGMTGPPAQR